MEERRAFLISQAKRRLRVGLKHLAEDIVQDAIAITLASPRHDPIPFAVAVIGKLAKNENKRKIELPLHTAVEIPDDYDVETAVDIEMTILRLFGDQLGKVVWSHFAHGYSIREIAREYGGGYIHWQRVLAGARAMLAFALKEYGSKAGGRDRYRYGGKSAKVLSSRKI